MNFQMQIGIWFSFIGCFPHFKSNLITPNAEGKILFLSFLIVFSCLKWTRGCCKQSGPVHWVQMFALWFFLVTCFNSLNSFIFPCLAQYSLFFLLMLPFRVTMLENFFCFLKWWIPLAIYFQVQIKTAFWKASPCFLQNRLHAVTIHV